MRGGRSRPAGVGGTGLHKRSEAKCGRPGGNRVVRRRFILDGPGDMPPPLDQRARAAAACLGEAARRSQDPVPSGTEAQRTLEARDGASRDGRITN